MDHMSHSGQIRNTLLCDAMVTILMLFGPFWCILVRHMCNPMTPPWLALTPLPFQVSIYSSFGSHRTNGSLRTNLKYLALSCYGHHFRTFWCILVHLGAFWCASYATPWPLHDLLWLLCPSKHPFTPEIDHMSHSGQISNYFALRCNGAHFVLFGPFWCILVRLMCNPMTPPWLALTPLPFQVFIYSRNGSH